jgi:hypothetical protein
VASNLPISRRRLIAAEKSRLVSYESAGQKRDGKWEKDVRLDLLR